MCQSRKYEKVTKTEPQSQSTVLQREKIINQTASDLQLDFIISSQTLLVCNKQHANVVNFLTTYLENFTKIKQKKI